MTVWIRGAASTVWITLRSKKARKLEAALIAYLVVELQRKGYLPLFPLPKI